MLAYRVLGVFSDLMTFLIWWGASLKTTKVIHKYSNGALPHRGSTEDYRPLLAFWFLGVAYESVLQLPIPLVGSLLAIWYPVYLALTLSMGDTILDTLISVARPVISPKPSAPRTAPPVPPEE